MRIRDEHYWSYINWLSKEKSGVFANMSPRTMERAAFGMQAAKRHFRDAVGGFFKKEHDDDL